MQSQSAIGVSAVVLLAVGAGIGAYVMHQIDAPPPPLFPPNENIVMGNKVYTDTGDFVAVIGRWDGPGLANKNNSAIVYCYKNRRECSSFSVDQIGPDQISDLNIPAVFGVTSWNDYSISASDGDALPATFCSKTTINIDRKGQSAEMVEEPVNQAALNCAKSDNKIYKFWLKDSLFWEKVRPNRKPGDN